MRLTVAHLRKAFNDVMNISESIKYNVSYKSADVEIPACCYILLDGTTQLCRRTKEGKQPLNSEKTTLV